MEPIGIVTATTNLERARPCIQTWGITPETPMVVIANGGETGAPYLGTVPAFRKGVDTMMQLHPSVEIIACLHDDLKLLDPSWKEQVETTFRRHPEVGLVGFGGALRLGSEDLFETPYDPMQLARYEFRSNLIDAEAHGSRSLLNEPVACLDGFSQIGRRAFWQGFSEPEWRTKETRRLSVVAPWTYLDHHHFVHHFYDGALGCLARRLRWGVRYVPVRCHHLGGQTAVGDPGYQHWAEHEINGGDRGFWEAAHRIGYDLFKDVLPLRARDDA